MSRPASKLLVAKSASTAFCGSGAVSSAMTNTPFCRALAIEGTMALVSLGVMRMPLAPALIMFSIAVTWPSLSPSLAPAPVSSLAPSLATSAVAPSFILTKNGLVSVLVMRPTVVPSPAKADPPDSTTSATTDWASRCGDAGTTDVSNEELVLG